MSRRVGLNDFKLKQGFRREYGTTVFAYLRSLRMELGRHHLRTSDATILEVANRVGYTNASHFARAFRQEFGCGPSQCRSLYKG